MWMLEWCGRHLPVVDLDVVVCEAFSHQPVLEGGCERRGEIGSLAWVRGRQSSLLSVKLTRKLMCVMGGSPWIGGRRGLSRAPFRSATPSRPLPLQECRKRDG